MVRGITREWHKVVVERVLVGLLSFEQFSTPASNREEPQSVLRVQYM